MSHEAHKDGFHTALVMGNGMRISKQHPKTARLNTLVLVFARKFSLSCDYESLTPAPSFSQGGGYKDQT